jgi:hypothetical protein
MCLSMRINGSPKPLPINLPNRPRFNRSWMRSTSQLARLAISCHGDMASSGGNHSLDGQPSCMWDNYQWMNALPSSPSTGRPFEEPVEDSAILDPDYVGAIGASWHQSAPSDTVSLGHTSPESSIGLPASRPMTRTTDPDSEMESGVALSALPASSAPPLPAARDTHVSTAQPPATSSSMSLKFVSHDAPIARIDDALPYDDPYAQTLPYGDDTLMDDS